MEKMKSKLNNFFKFNNFQLFSFYFFISIILTYLFNGIDSLSFYNTEWLFTGDDRSTHQIGWFFFKNDIWRFPLGSNPNFGNEIGNSIIYSDSIPIFALLFKLINFLLPEKFQYFSIWFILCFFLQGVLSYFLILNFTKNKKIAVILSFLFLLFPPALYRIDWHPALFAHWILILTVLLVFKKENVKDIHWILLILLTSLIHFYFTVIVLIIFNSIKIFNFISKKIKPKNYFTIFLKCHLSLVLLMYLVGYFEVRLIDTFALGFGNFKINLLSIFDSTISQENMSWSLILPGFNLSYGEELEGFNFLGIGGIFLIALGFFIFIKDKDLRLSINKRINNGVYFSLILIAFLSLSNSIAIGNLIILNIPLFDFFYGPLSIIRSSGRLFWIISYFTLFLSIYLISLKFKNKSSIIFLVIVLIQLADISKGLIYYINKGKNYQEISVNDIFWKNKEVKQLKKIITTNPANYNKHFDKLAYYIEDNKIKKTNLVKMARIDRSKAAKNRYKLAENFSKNNLENDTLYIIDNVGHLLILREIFKNDQVGFFFKDNLWLMIKDKEYLMNSKDKEILNKLNIYEPIFFKEKKLKFKDNNSFVGLGWSHNLNDNGIWSEGKTSNLLFKFNERKKNILFEMNVIPFINEKNKEIDIEVLVNGKFNNKIKFKLEDNSQAKKKKVIFEIKKENIKENIVNIEFKNKRPISPFDMLLSPDSRKLNFLLLNFSFFPKDI